MAFLQKLLSMFPVPEYLSMPAAGLDVSDHSMKFVEFEGPPGRKRVSRFGTKSIPDGVIVGGTIARREALVDALAELREEHGLRFVRASLPEEPAYIFTTQVPDVRHEEVRSLLQFKLEENVPISPAEAVIDFDVLPRGMGGGELPVTVSVFPEKLAQDYTDLLKNAQLMPLSLEIEAQAIARAVVPNDFEETCIVVDIGRTRSGVSIVSNGLVRFTTTIDVGGDVLGGTIQKELPNLSPEEVVRLKNQEGLHYKGNEAVATVFRNFARALRNEIERYYIYWHTHLKEKESKFLQHPSISRVFLTGGNANVAGLEDFLSHELFLSVERANVWVNVSPFDDHVPPVSFEESLGYASAIGLALHTDD